MLINPPYAEATSGAGKDGKVSVAKTKVAKYLMEDGKAGNELFVQFVTRILKELPNCTLAMFSTLKYVNAPNFENFRAKFKANYLGGFIVHSKAFEGLKGNFPIGFLIWKLNKKATISQISTEVVNKEGQAIGQKTFYNFPKSSYFNVWLKRPKANQTFALPLTNAINVATKTKIRLDKWSDNAVAYFSVRGNDNQNNNFTCLLSSVLAVGNGIYVNAENLADVAVIFTVRKIIKPTWINDRDQFLQPNQTLSTEFYNDCLIYMLFHGSNLTASANNLEYQQQEYSIVNHFIPFTEEEINSKDRFESHFLIDYLKNKKFSKEAKEVLKSGQKLWQLYFEQSFNHKIREEFKLNRADVGWYQIKKALEKKAETDFNFKTTYNTLITGFKTNYKILEDKIEPQVYDYEFLKP